jgi:uncharacterized protein DUF4380
MSLEKFISGFILILIVFPLHAADRTKIASSSTSSPYGIVTLKNSKVELKIALNIGGRVTSFRRSGAQNILLFSPPVNDSKIPFPSPTGYFPMYNGHITWVGPQKEWWSQQSVNKERLQRKAPWPPDPYLCVGRYKIVKQTPVLLIIRGPSNPVSGLTLTKSYELQEDGSVDLTVSAENTSGRVLFWDIWSNTRMSQNAKVFVPLAEIDNKFVLKIHFDTKDLGKEQALKFDVIDGLFTFVPTHNKTGVAEVAKAYIDSFSGKIFAFNGKNLFIKQTKYPGNGRIHPDQAFIEIYQRVTPSGEEGILELEFHSAYTEIKQGEKIEFKESWKLLPYNGKDTAEEQINYLKREKIL